MKEPEILAANQLMVGDVVKFFEGHSSSICIYKIADGISYGKRPYFQMVESDVLTGMENMQFEHKYCSLKFTLLGNVDFTNRPREKKESTLGT